MFNSDVTDSDQPSIGLPLSSRQSLPLLLAASLLVIVAAVAAAMAWGLKPTFYFDEGQPVTFYSALQLLAAAGLCLAVWARRRTALWLLLAAGGAYLAADELFALHERFDLALHGWLGLKQTPLSDRFDDAVLLLYGAGGLGLLRLFAKESRAFASVRPLLRLTIALFFAAVLADALCDDWGFGSSRATLASASGASITPWRMLGHAAHVLEDAFKLATESVAISLLIGLVRPDRSPRAVEQN